MQLLCSSRNGPALLGISDIELLDILTINEEKMGEHYCKIRNLNLIPYPMIDNNNNCNIDYFLPSLNREAKRRASAKITKLMHNEFLHVFLGISCFEGTSPYR